MTAPFPLRVSGGPLRHGTVGSRFRIGDTFGVVGQKLNSLVRKTDPRYVWRLRH